MCIDYTLNGAKSALIWGFLASRRVLVHMRRKIAEACGRAIGHDCRQTTARAPCTAQATEARIEPITH